MLGLAEMGCDGLNPDLINMQFARSFSKVYLIYFSNILHYLGHS